MKRLERNELVATILLMFFSFVGGILLGIISENNKTLQKQREMTVIIEGTMEVISRTGNESLMVDWVDYMNEHLWEK